MFEVKSMNQVVFQLTLVGKDEAVVAALYDALVSDTGGVSLDVDGTDGNRARQMTYLPGTDSAGREITAHVSMVASACLQFDAPPLCRGQKTARELAVMGLDACISLDGTQLSPELLGNATVTVCEAADLTSLYQALDAAIDTLCAQTLAHGPTAMTPLGDEVAKLGVVSRENR